MSMLQRSLDRNSPADVLVFDYRHEALTSRIFHAHHVVPKTDHKTRALGNPSIWFQSRSEKNTVPQLPRGQHLLTPNPSNDSCRQLFTPDHITDHLTEKKLLLNYYTRPIYTSSSSFNSRLSLLQSARYPFSNREPRDQYLLLKDPIANLRYLDLSKLDNPHILQHLASTGGLNFQRN